MQTFPLLRRFRVTLELCGVELSQVGQRLVIPRGPARSSARLARTSTRSAGRASNLHLFQLVRSTSSLSWCLVVSSLTARPSRQEGSSSLRVTTGDHLGSLGGIQSTGILLVGPRHSWIVIQFLHKSLTRPSHFSGRWTEQAEWHRL